MGSAWKIGKPGLAWLLAGLIPLVPKTVPLSSVEMRGGGAHSNMVSSRLMNTAARRPGSLASGELHLVGLRLTAPSARMDVPKDAPFSVPVGFFIGDRPATSAELGQLLPSDTLLRGVLTDPSGHTTELIGSIPGGFSGLSLPQAGDYQISDIRLEKDGVRLYKADPKIVDIHCLGDVLVSSVTSEPMNMDEIRKAGIQVGQGNYQARRFTMALSGGGRRVDLLVPVAIPVYNGVESLSGDSEVGRLEIKSVGASSEPLPDSHVAMAEIRMEPTFALNRPEVAHLVNHGFKALVVIPGSIGYLHQFYKMNLVVLNVLPDGSPYVVRNVTATTTLPPGADGGVGTGDDPLRFAVRDGESSDPIKNLLGPGSNDQPGTGSQTLAPGISILLYSNPVFLLINS